MAMVKRISRMLVLTMIVSAIGLHLVQHAFANEVAPQTGLHLWLKADAGVTADTSGAVSEWESDSGIVLSQTENNRKPQLIQDAINGFPAIKFTNDYLSTSLDTTYTGDYSVYLVMKLPRTFTNGATFFSTTNPAGGKLTAGPMFLQRAAKDGFIKLTFKYADTDATSQNHPLVSPENHWEDYGILCVTLNGRQFTTFVNGNETYSSTDSKLSSSSTFSYYGLGARDGTGNFAECEIAELLVYHTAQSDEERKAVENYLGSKYFDSPFDVAAYEDDTRIDDFGRLPVTINRIEIDFSAPRLNTIDPHSINNDNIKLFRVETNKEYPLEIAYDDSEKKGVLTNFGSLEYGASYHLIIKGKEDCVGEPLREETQVVQFETEKWIETKDTKFTDANGADITSLKGQPFLNTKVLVENHFEDSQKTVLIVGLFKGDTLVKMSSNCVELQPKGTDWLSVGLALPSDTMDASYQEGTYQIRAFMIDDFSTLHVLKDVIEFE